MMRADGGVAALMAAADLEPREQYDQARRVQAPQTTVTDERKMRFRMLMRCYE